MSIGFTELLLIVFLLIALIKPSKLKEIASWTGCLYREIAGLKQDISDSVESIDVDIKDGRGVNSDENGVS